MEFKNLKTIVLTGLLALIPTKDVGHVLFEETENVKRTIVSYVDSPNQIGIANYIAQPLEMYANTQALEEIVDNREPIEMNTSVLFETNPFKNKRGKSVEGKVFEKDKTWEYLEKTAQLMEEKYYAEQKAIKRIGWMRDALINKEVKGDVKKQFENNILKLIPYHGRIATSYRSKKSYDKNLVKTKKRLEKEGRTFDWVDCTKPVFESFGIASGDNKLSENYNKYAGQKWHLTHFPKKVAAYFQGDYDIIYVAKDTKAKKWSNRYWIGGTKMSHAKPFYNKAKKGTYYIKTEYFATDKLIKSNAFKQYIQQTPGILLIEEFLHVATLSNGMMVDAKWGSSPLQEANYQQRSLYELLNVEQEENKENIRSMIMIMPKGSVQTFIDKNVDEVN